MKRVTLHGRNFRESIPCEEIERRIRALAERINCDYREKPLPLFVVILNGAFMFASKVLREIDFPCEVSFVKFTSYTGMAYSGKVRELIGLTQDVRGREVIVLEDIVETGETIEALDQMLCNRGAAGIGYAVLFLKPEKYRKSIPIRYAAMEIGDDFIVGYGLDYDGLGRNLKDIYTIIEE
ncbi:MAG: hypoxanthine phosphoribosyltransferase [Rikenellaceae bacterium]|jgi:hypoxanthine phosphoribosyltransferase|nr:hypoxanthine phosphoribosyltransferase [Rikenellaceae bacterium]